MIPRRCSTLHISICLCFIHTLILFSLTFSFLVFHQFTLHVPDTQDVKNAFSTMSNTIVSQEEHIDELNTNMMAMEQEFKKDQERIMQWAHESIEKLVQKNEVMTTMLNQTRQQMRAMTYNMKGIDDGAKDEDLVQAMKNIEETQTTKPTPVVTRQGMY